MGEKATPEQCAAFRVRYGLNDNVFIHLSVIWANSLRAISAIQSNTIARFWTMSPSGIADDI